MIQRKIFNFGALILLFMLPLVSYAQKGEKIQTIVIDAGHGGKDTGALGVMLALGLCRCLYQVEEVPIIPSFFKRTFMKECLILSSMFPTFSEITM